MAFFSGQSHRVKVRVRGVSGLRAEDVVVQLAVHLYLALINAGSHQRHVARSDLTDDLGPVGKRRLDTYHKVVISRFAPDADHVSAQVHDA